MKLTETNEITNAEQDFVRALLEASIHAILLVEPMYENDVVNDFKIKATNAALTTHCGIQPAEVVDIPFSHIFPNFKKYGFFDLYITAFETKKQQRSQLYYKDEKLEGWFDFGVAPHGNILVINFGNITEHQNFQKELDLSAHNLNTIINTTQSGIFLFAPVQDLNGNIVDFKFTTANPSFASYVGKKPENIVGDLATKWFPGYKENGLFDQYKDTYETGRSKRFDFHYDADGIDVWLDIMATKLDNEVLITFTDFTSVKKLQLQLEETIKELTRSNASLQDFAYIASHDLQEPLRKIHFFADRLKQRYKPIIGKEGEMIIERIEAASSRMGTLINDLLDYSQVSSLPSNTSIVNLQDLINEVLFDLEAILQEKNAQVKVEKMPVLKADPILLRQMFQNLIGNALKYQEPGARPIIHIKAGKLPGKQLSKHIKSGDQHKEFYLIEVIDNGVGFLQENAERIFQIFQRLHGRSEYPGTGVGLAIVQKVIENHNGYIWATSTPGNGSTFHVLLPAS